MNMIEQKAIESQTKFFLDLFHDAIPEIQTNDRIVLVEDNPWHSHELKKYRINRGKFDYEFTITRYIPDYPTIGQHGYVLLLVSNVTDRDSKKITVYPHD